MTERLPSKSPEQGSFFSWPTFAPAGGGSSPWDGRGTFWSSGRDAFRALSSSGERRKSWRRLWIPSYFCGPVVTSFRAQGLEVVRYAANPQTGWADAGLLKFRPGDVLFVVNFFGLQSFKPVRDLFGADLEIIEDHTHDPWSDWAGSSQADWCIASLRKTLPIPDGGVLWSPAGRTLPKPRKATSAHAKISLDMLAAMSVKSLYLEGHDIPKELYLDLARGSEERFAAGRLSGMTDWSAALLKIMPVREWRDARTRNYGVLRDALARRPWVSVLQPEIPDAGCPFAGILVFDSGERREAVRRKLIESSIYPAVLWPQESADNPGASVQDIDLGRRILAIHCDMRYNEYEMTRVAKLVVTYGEKGVG
jgi:hypothetical protein